MKGERRPAGSGLLFRLSLIHICTTSTSRTLGARATIASTSTEGVPHPDWIQTRSPDTTASSASAALIRLLRYSSLQLI